MPFQIFKDKSEIRSDIMAKPAVVIDNDSFHENNNNNNIKNNDNNSSSTVVDDENSPIEIDYEALPENSSLLAQLLAGAFAGISEHAIMFPIDAIKTRMQISKTSLPKGIIASVSKISSTEGATVLWRGISSMILGAGPAHAVYFSVFESTKTLMVNYMYHANNKSYITDGNHPLIASFSGVAATTASDALMTPFDTLKQRMQALQPTKDPPPPLGAGAGAGAASSSSTTTTTTASSSIQSLEQKTKSMNLFKLASYMYKHEGFSTFYVSYPTTLSMNIPFAALNFGVYEWSSSILNPENKYNPLLHCVSGGISGAIAAAITTPLDCIKTALQTRGISSDPNLRKARGFKDATIALYKQNGYAAFMRGLRPRVVFNVPSTAICWTAYEMAKAYLIKD
ncbi:hypothetical protein PACTADRAFT_51215 [Pachysolen tannophilus NRRL Y-2460]|uniref:Mitochondrial carrier protein n=1 Tax=Pachysolen tannophilus NRRL Y-2460 TaxID=669874 RepID=A0A1E4TRJ3_PACTA|nr:hypothetical protein PACTADRAFT_51215 [Pachysolen tannophilus NRRL Y-2460]